MSEMIKSFATMLLADAFWSEWEDDEFVIDLITQEERETFRRSYAGSGCEVVQGLEYVIEDLEIDIKPFLPISLVQKIVDHVNNAWSEKYSVEQLHEYCQRASHRLILGQIGHGVTATDDPNIGEMFEELEIKVPHSISEGAYEEGWSLVREVEQRLAHKAGHQWVKCSTSKYTCLILVQDIGNGKAWFSVKATSLDSFKSSWVTNMPSIVDVTASSKWKHEVADWEMPFDEAILKMRTLEEQMKVAAFKERINRDLEKDQEEFDWL
jgi:hypothetical protein